MTLIVYLVTAVSVIFLFPLESEGVRCYACYYNEGVKGPSSEDPPVFPGNTTGLRKLEIHPSCKTSKPKFVVECQYGCTWIVVTQGGKSGYARECSQSTDPKSGCKPPPEGYGGQVCYCSTDLCNSSYTLSYQGILMAIGLVTSITIRRNLI